MKVIYDEFNVIERIKMFLFVKCFSFLSQKFKNLLLKFIDYLFMYKQGCSGGYTGIHAVYLPNFNKERCIPSVSQESYCIHILGYILCLEHISSA